MEADYQQDKQPHVNRVAVLRVVAIGLDVGDGHGEINLRKNRKKTNFAARIRIASRSGPWVGS